jgi:hypothetical protein
MRSDLARAVREDLGSPTNNCSDAEVEEIAGRNKQLASPRWGQAVLIRGSNTSPLRFTERAFVAAAAEQITEVYEVHVGSFTLSGAAVQI